MKKFGWQKVAGCEVFLCRCGAVLATARRAMECEASHHMVPFCAGCGYLVDGVFCPRCRELP